MIIQFAFISILYFTFMLPEIIVGVIEALWDSTFLSDIQYSAYFVNQFLPFIIVGSLPNIYKQFREWIQFIKRAICLRGHIEPL
ncbi:unnamed protein product [Adineta ricciae]|uniref:Uncharacterized protein n=1 Tax=Adineta ricciae TaxID=249248 RepID=A0A815NU16_ADIRI|nr:unnamed protein product [Adineta ricciae]CAF1442907.1 unnamed protein product [Adineta ricciae]